MKREYPELRKFVAPEFIFGVGARHHAGRYAANLGAQKVFVVTDPGVIEAGWVKDVEESLTEAGVAYTLYSKVSPNPRAEEVMAAAAAFRSNGCNAIVAVGGGSPMDCAKGVGIVSTNRRHILEFEGADRVSLPGPPLICIPTTGGTSADVSQFAIITNSQEKVKIAIVSKMVVPDVSLVDPETLMTMDPYLTACTGLDALTHAIEAFVSNASSPITDMHALEAIRMISENLVPAIRNPNSIELRTKVMLGSLEAGLAFSNAILGAVHAMAHSLGGFLDLPHGECNSILLPHVIAYNYSAAPERFLMIGKAMGLDIRGMNSVAKRTAILRRVAQLRRKAGVGRGLSGLGVKTADLSVLSGKAIKDPCMVTNPRRPNLRDIEVIYEEAL